MLWLNTGSSRLAEDAQRLNPIRVCRAWPRAYGVEVPMPGFRGAEGKEKSKSLPRARSEGVIVRWSLEEAQSESAGQACPGLDPGNRNRI